MEYAKATIYRLGMFGYRAERVSKLRIEEGVQYAQYPNAVRMRYVPKGKRKDRLSHETSYPSLVVVDGWDAPRTTLGHFDATDRRRSQGTAVLLQSGPANLTHG